MPLFSLLGSSPSPPPQLYIPAASPFPRTSVVAGLFSVWRNTTNTGYPLLQCGAVSRAPAEGEYIDVILSGFPVRKWPSNIATEGDTQKDKYKGEEVRSNERRDRMVEMIKSMLRSMDDGEISISPYDTAWVALVEDIGGKGQPQFPTSIEWISNNQLEDGSWGDSAAYSAHDRILNTLACVVALRSWKMHQDKTDKGVTFIRKNIHRLDEEKEEHMPIGFEVALPSLIETAKKLGIDVPNDSPALQKIYARRELKLTRIPRDIMHKVPTTLLHSLEGMSSGLEWQELLKLQCPDGSFLFSPSSTAFALQQTKDENCLKYLLKHVRKFNGGVPNVYPVDLFERLWAVDRLQRLGISRYFQPEIEECLGYVHRYWTDKGICWARNSQVQDVDDTAMGFRLLRLHGYRVSADVFKNFKQDEEFFCFAGQSNQAVTGMYNLYRASQVMFPGEVILAEARKFSHKFLQEKRANNELLDKWIITKDLPGEVGFALDIPWYASLPRIETRFFLEQYGGGDDVWIGKTLYRMPYIDNRAYLDLAKLDYNNCQALHQSEWKSFQKWYRSCRLEEFGLSETTLVQTYYIAAASIFEPERLYERLAWAKTAILMETVMRHSDQKKLSKQQKHALVNEFKHCALLGERCSKIGRYKTRNNLIGTLVRSVNELSLDAPLARYADIQSHLHRAWQKWLSSWEEGDTGEGDAELLVCTLNLCGGGRSSHSRWSDKLLLSYPPYQPLVQIASRVCHHLRLSPTRKEEARMCEQKLQSGVSGGDIEGSMQELVRLALAKSHSELEFRVKQNFLLVARSYYYTAYCNPATINLHIAKVLFETVVLECCDDHTRRYF
ncbi:ent-copalyl diphosphate synthase 1-like isoform X2 [Andrographis paniculata]|uniref:ent-copalyl diphosphate synthase 1-like isoform X2 n=1 Tax=Andrographis paniculata TaxID=175694 RepID=UPI0021E81EBB|nr:ent-copalyl diphosphate synthase 1-like isoform X2 [Andrographis paniculata]